MSRDEIAARCLAGLLSNSAELYSHLTALADKKGLDVTEFAAECAVDYADALLVQLAKRKAQ